MTTYSLDTTLQELEFDDSFYIQSGLDSTDSVKDLFAHMSSLISNGEKDLFDVLSSYLKEYPGVVGIIEREQLIDVFYGTKSSPDIS